jgi:diguanylate cyclase (GGDEF)-like protein/PAS domain S-box-containing protein
MGLEAKFAGRPSREALENLAETVPALVYIAEMGLGGRWRYVSPQVTELLGYEPDEWLEDPTLWFNSIHPDDVETAISWEHLSPAVTQTVPQVEYRLRRKDGTWVWVFESTRLVVDPSGGPPLWHGVISDISALKEAERSAERKAAQQAMTARLGAAALGTSDQQELIEMTLAALMKFDDIVGAEIWEYVDGDRIRMRHRAGYDGPELTLEFEGDRYPGNELAAGRTVIISDWSSDERLERYAEHGSPSVASTMVVPIEGAIEPFGFLSIHASVPNRFSSQDEDFLVAATSLLSATFDRNRIERSLRHRLLHDALTELPNRELFAERLEEAISISMETGKPMAALFFDIDHFKLINDGIGHHVGDGVLRAVGSRLRGGLPEQDTVARFGGDEFGIVISQVESAGATVELAERILELLDEPIRFEGSEIVVSASIGVALFEPRSDPGKPVDFLIREANAAMHEAKNLGRAQVRLFDQSMKNTALNRLNTESGLRSAIEREELELHFQPAVAIPSNLIVGFEALVRWRHPERGLIEPPEFIPVAEESGLISRIDSWALEETVRHLAGWRDLIPADRPFLVSVNASARQLNRAGLPAEIKSLIESHGIDPAWLAVEITENTLITGSSSVRGVLEAIHEVGVRLALDDFGTGFSSLSHLSQFPFDLIKIDRSFIEQLGSGEAAGPAITDAILRIGKALDMTVVAEGVSTRTELDLVRDLGCQVVQGYLVSRPVPAEEAGKMLARGSVSPQGLRVSSRRPRA